MSPSHPYVNDVVTVSWTNQRTMPDNRRYEGFINIRGGGQHCSALVVAYSDRGLKKGVRVRLRFDGAKGEFPLNGPRWCAGHASFTVGATSVRPSPRSRFIGYKDFRIYPAPNRDVTLPPL